jgi:MFS family permease
VFAGLFLAQAAGTSALLNYAGIFAFGAFALPLYSLSAAHANDRARPGQFVLVAAGLSFFFSLGAAVGPVLAAWVMKTFGVSAFFTYTSVVHASLVVVTLWRMRVRGRPLAARTRRFVTLLRTSPALTRMAQGTSGQERPEA